MLILCLVLLVSSGSLVEAWNADAGLVAPLGAGTRTISVTSNPGAAANIIDGNENTQWQSDACLPTGFISRPELNPVLNACATAGRCTATTGSASLNSAFDASFYTGASIKLAGSAATIKVGLIGPTDINRLRFRGNWGKAGIAKVTLVAGTKRTLVATVNVTTNWVDQVVVPPAVVWPGVSSVEVSCSESFTLTELALQGGRCFEQATLDMKAVVPISLIRARWWSPDSINTSLLISQDGVAWTMVRADLWPTSLPAMDLWYNEAPLTARYVAVRHIVKEDADWRKVYMWELAAYGQGGRWGPAPAPVTQTRTMRQLLGVNGIWGWGSNAFSDTLLSQGLGPLLYNAVASSGRNYESMVWDVKQPGNDPKWDTMNKTGTDGQWWLDWDREYSAWKRGGLPVAVSFQFTARDQPPSSWPDFYNTAFALGFKFARHFGPAGTANVASFEAGNEPWDYNATVYTQLLRGFIDGAYAGDPSLTRLPCALQANDPTAETASGGNYIGARLPADLAPKVDALNLHIYSFFNNETGTRIGVHPEHPGSSMNGLHNMLAWRNANMPGVPVWVTEWGWDAARPGEVCGATECVSQLAQAAYGIRGLAILARKGVAASHWFFYADSDQCATLFCRSGLRDTVSRSFAELPVYRAFKALMQLAGPTYFTAAPVETPSVYVHLLSNSSAGSPSYALVWRPVPVGDVEAVSDTVMLTFDVGFVAPTGPTRAWKLTGALPDGRVAGGVPVMAGRQWTMPVSSIPTLVVLAAA